MSFRDRARLFLPLRSWRLQLIGVAVAIAAAIASAQSFASARESAATYLIQPGDTLSSIAMANGVSLDRLIGFNGIKNPDLIIAGQTLSLTGAAASTSNDVGGSKYTVKSGDTLWDISVATGTSFDELIKANSLSNADQLTIGQVLSLPGLQHAANNAVQKPKSTPTPTPTATPKAKPTQAPSPTPAASPLQQRVAAEAQRVGGANVHVGVAAVNLVTGEKIGWHADDAFPTASVMKLPILVELERQIAAGTLSWTESLRAEVGAMVAVSDNSAANQIAAVIHPQSVKDR